MTILPKKKQTKDKNEVGASEHPHPSHSHQLGSVALPGVEQRHESRVTARRPNSPPQRWGSPTPREDPRMGPGHDPGGLFDEFSAALDQGSSGHNKRRHRSSPHRSVRKHRGWEPSHPSTSGHAHGHAHSHSHRHQNYRNDRPSTSEELEVVPALSEENLVDELEGYNSGDEYGGPPRVPENIEELEIWFERAIKEKTGFIVRKMHEDGACLFRAVADQVYGDQEMHDIVRKNCVDYMAKNSDFFRHYVTEDFDSYLNRKRVNSSHGNHIEIQAMCEIFNRPIEVYQYSIEPINSFHGSYKTDNEPIRLSYHGSVHYNSLVNPVKATVGVGLGLPGLQPGLADKTLMHDAVRQSEEYHIESTMLEDKLRETDWEVTQESIEEQVARESYLQWLRDLEKNANKQSTNPNKTASATCSSASESQSMWECTNVTTKSPETRAARSPRNRSNNTSAQNSPNRPMDGVEGLPSPKPTDSPQFLLPGGSIAPSSPRPSTTTGEGTCSSQPLEGAVGGSFMETSSLMNDVQSQMINYSEWDEDDILAQVIAQSQHEYLDNLRRRAGNHGNSSTSSSPYGGSSPAHDSGSEPQPPEPPTKSKNSHNNAKGSSGKNS